ncbi:isocitrate lyase/phosphoenolpyruvate mutase family protein [Enterocloster asparagiformis]|uniref:Carboxyvinyl-carboxyphosphonate phosphorylmutase n=1 Tax=[Clostridium] asparagiforme DSM 15981 TaxID=518636 RepID=C0D910_9FIRM|nr:isocitrate lyase/phosphoenolpyruvate mutase family protein [Enterocloster asparagiformis]EEG52182.1 hypothetical protein CLOSTASPAR_05759 [[Clostridium] asparagiforme DSM 15981]
MYIKSFRQLIEENDRCLMVPCVYDCASARAVEIVGFESMMLSGGELSMAMNGIIEHDTSNFAECEWMAGRIARSSNIPLAVDIGDGWAKSPIAIYRECKRLAAIGVTAIQMEDASSYGILPEGAVLREGEGGGGCAQGYGLYLNCADQRGCGDHDGPVL